MTDSLSKILADSEGKPIDYNGKKITLSFISPIDSGQEIELEFIKHNDNYRQGIEASVDRKKGYIEVNGQKIISPVFWTDTAPKKIRFKCYSSKPKGQIRIWNVWQNIEYKDSIDAWIGNAGLYCEKEGSNTYTIHCSNGIGEVCFEDLVVVVKFV